MRRTGILIRTAARPRTAAIGCPVVLCLMLGATTACQRELTPDVAQTPEQAVELLAEACRAGDPERALKHIAQPFRDVMMFYILGDEADDILYSALDTAFGPEPRPGFRTEVQRELLRIRKLDILTKESKGSTKVKLTIRETLESLHHEEDDVVEVPYTAVQVGEGWKLLRPFRPLILLSGQRRPTIEKWRQGNRTTDFTRDLDGLARDLQKWDEAKKLAQDLARAHTNKELAQKIADEIKARKYSSRHEALTAYEAARIAAMRLDWVKATTKPKPPKLPKLPKTTVTNDLKQLGLAVHHDLDSRGRFAPAAIFSEEGTPLLSWRVRILPYLREQELFKQFKLDEPWDSPHNKALIERIPDIYRPVGDTTTDPGHTHYQVFVGKGTLFDGPEGMKVRQVTDSLAETLLIVEAAEPVPWSKPADLVYSPEEPLPRLGASAKDGFHAVFADGRVKFLRNPDEKTIRSAISPSGSD